MHLSHEIIEAAYLVREVAAQTAARWGEEHEVKGERLAQLINQIRGMDLERMLR